MLQGRVPTWYGSAVNSCSRSGRTSIGSKLQNSVTKMFPELQPRDKNHPKPASHDFTRRPGRKVIDHDSGCSGCRRSDQTYDVRPGTVQTVWMNYMKGNMFGNMRMPATNWDIMTGTKENIFGNIGILMANQEESMMRTKTPISRTSACNWMERTIEANRIPPREMRKL
jgi:hypothetical protein